MLVKHPIILPTFLCRPCLVNGIPIFLEIFCFIDEIPKALFQEKEIPNLRPISFHLFLTIIYNSSPGQGQ